MKLDFIVVGAAKSGTTSLFKTLCQFNQLSLFQLKDIHFFAHDEIYARGPDWYWKQFKSSALDSSLYYKNDSDNCSDKVYGEVSSNYLYSENALNRIKYYSKDNVKIIVLLRDPLERLVSEYKHHLRNGLLTKPLNYYLNHPEAENEGTRYKPWHLLIERSLYGEYVKNLYSQFSNQQVHIINSNQFKNEAQSCIDELCQFIDIEPKSIIPESTNSAFNPRSTAVMKLLTKSSFVTRIARRLFPSFKIRQKIRDLIIQINTSSKTKTVVSDKEIALARSILSEHKAFEFKF